MLSLTDFLSFLPGVMPKKAKDALFQGDILGKDERKDMFSRDAYYLDTAQLVGPDAAGAILAAYQAGKLPLNRGKKVCEAPQAVEYVNDNAIREQSRERRRRRDCVKDISLVKESDFSDNRLLDGIFWEHLGKGGGSLKLAGIDVFKTFHGYSSNTGASKGYEVTFHWTGSDGERRSSGTGKPAEAFNRRNDAERDWGLPD